MSTLSSRGKAWETTRKRILDRDLWVCQYCAAPLEGANATVDHIVPKIEGGTDSDSNLMASCRSCNGAKSGRMIIRSPWFNRRWLDSVPHQEPIS